MNRIDGRAGGVPSVLRCRCGAVVPVRGGRSLVTWMGASCESWYAVALCCCGVRREWAWPSSADLLAMDREYFAGKEAGSWSGRPRSWVASWGRPPCVIPHEDDDQGGESERPLGLVQ